MANNFDEYPPIKIGDKTIDPAGADYVDSMGYEYFFGIMQMRDSFRPIPLMIKLTTDEEGKLFCFSEFEADYEGDHDAGWILLDQPIQDAFQAYIMEKIILGEVAHNRSDCDQRESA